MIARNSNQAAIGSAPQKRSLFNKPSWSRPQPLSNDTDLFHRSNQTYADLAAETERARKRKLAKKKRKRANQSVTGERAGKRRRTSEDEEDEDDEDDDTSSYESSSHSSRKGIKMRLDQSENDNLATSTKPRKPKPSPKSLLKRYEAKIAASKVGEEQRQKPKVFDIIDLENEKDSSALSEKESNWISVRPAAPPGEDAQPVSDEEFPELARQAREKARRKRLEEDIVSTAATSQDSELSLHQSIPPASQPDPILQILITSDIENTIPLIISRRLSQRLKDVRLTWAKRQNFTTDFTDTVFLTWRGKRVFDVTTCKSLGIIVDAIGRVSTKGGSWEEEEGQIHMEAMTTKILEAYKESKRNEANAQEGVIGQEQAVAMPDHEAQVRIILKAKGLEDFKLQVRPSTLVSKIVNAFRSRYQIGEEKDVFLSFDGERMSPDSRIEETELSDLDTIEVYHR